MDNLSPRTRFWLAAGASLVILAALALVFMNDKARAQEVYVGVHGGKAMANTDITDTAGFFDLNGLGSSGYVGGVHAGIDATLAKSVLFGGVFGGYDWGSNEFKASAGTSTFSASLGNSYYVGVRAGITPASGSKIYALAAYRVTEFSSSVPTLTLSNPRGWDLGIGAEMPLAKNVSLGVEGIRTQYEKGEFQFGAPSMPTGIHGETDVLSVMARLNFQFGSFPATGIFDDRRDVAPAKGCDKKLGNC